MTLSEARIRANKKWDAANLATFTIKIKKDKADLFRAAAARAGKSPGEILREAVDKTIKEYTE